MVSVTQQIDLSGMVGQVVDSLTFGLAEIDLERQSAGIYLPTFLPKKRGFTVHELVSVPIFHGINHGGNLIVRRTF
jgi:hypothetical protein